MSPHSPDGKKSGGRPAGYVLSKGADGGPRRRKAPPVPRLAVADPARVPVTRALVQSLDPPRGATLYTRILAVLVRGLRVMQGLSQGELALACGTSHQELAQLEAAKHGAMVETWLRLCGALWVPYSRFVKCAELCAASGW